MDPKLTITLAFVLILSAVFDLRSHRIPNYLTYSAILFGIIYNTVLTGLDGLIFSSAGIITGIGVLIIFYIIGGMGAGDVKLLGAVGSFLGANGVFGSFIFSAIAGGIYSLILILVFRRIYSGVLSNIYFSGVHMIMTRKLLDFGTIHTDNRPRLCYGLVIAIGTGIYLFLQINEIEVFFL